MTPRWAFPGLVVVVTASGSLMGFLWWVLSPVVPGLYVSITIFPRENQPNGYIAADAYFAIGAAFMGLLVAYFVRRTWRGSPVLAVLGLALGGVAGAALAVLTGYAFSAPQFPDVPVGSFAPVPLTLGAAGWLMVWPIASVGLWFVFDLFTWRSQPHSLASS